MSISRWAERSQLRRIALADEHHVDVAGVVELAAAELAHADHGELGGSPSDVDEPVGRAEHVGGQRRQGGDGLGQRVEVEQVTGGDAQLLEALPPSRAAPASPP